MAKSIFDPRNSDGTLSGGLDNFTTPPAQSHSKMPEDLTDGVVEEDAEEAELEKQAETDPTQAVEQIKEALDEKRHEESPASPLQGVDGPNS